MKICFISPKAYPIFNPKVKSTIGGAEVQLHMLAIELAKREDLDIHFIVADYGQEEVEEYKGVKVWSSLDFKSNKLSQILSFFKVFNKINADVYIQRTLTVESGLIALYSKLRRKKFVYMVAHDSEADGTHPLYRSKIKAFFAKLALKLANVVFVQNEYEKDYLINQMNVNKIVLLKKGLDLSKVKSSSNKKYDAVWVGRSVKWKRPEEFLKLAKENSKKKFLIICLEATGDEDLFKEIKREAESITNLEFISFATQKEVYTYLSESRVFILTSEKEGDWPMTVLEAAVHGLPIISLSLNYNSLIDEYNGGIFCEGDEVLLDKCFNKILTERDLYRKTSKRAHRYVKENHNIELNGDKFLSEIDEI